MSVAPLPTGSDGLGVASSAHTSTLVIFVDGVEFGEAICREVLPKLKAQRTYAVVLQELHNLLDRHDNVRQIMQQQPMFEPLLVSVLRNRMNLASSVSSSFSLLTVDEAKQIGSSLAASLAINTSAAAAVDEWILRYPALSEVDDANEWFRPMMEVVAKKLLRDAGWGARFRLYFGAGLSILDMVTDVNAIRVMLVTEGLENSGYFLLYFLLANLAGQLLTVYVQNRRGPKSRLLREMLYVVTCVKVGVDAYRVASDAKEETYNVFDPLTELGECFVTFPGAHRHEIHSSHTFLVLRVSNTSSFLL